jgi:hypothetical protein
MSPTKDPKTTTDTRASNLSQILQNEVSFYSRFRVEAFACLSLHADATKGNAGKSFDVKMTFSEFQTNSVGTAYIELGRLQQRARNEKYALAP